MTHYFRITGYYSKEDICFIMDSNGKFEKLWQFSAYLISKGCKVLEVSTDEKFLDINIDKVEENKERIFLRALGKGKPSNVEKNMDDFAYKAVLIEGKIYIPDKT